MTIKIPNFDKFNLKEKNYFIAGEKIFVMNTHYHFDISKKGEKVVLPTKYHIELLKIDTELKTVEHGIWIIPN